jgi:hypothetical protein
MNGHFRDSKRGKHVEKTIENWMLTTINEGGVERWDDLHMDEIDESWEPRSFWLEAAVYAYSTALSLRDQFELCVTIMLLIPLRRELEGGLDTLEQVDKNLDEITPPSLYLLRPGMHAVPEGDPSMREVSICNVQSIFGASIRAKRCYAAAFTNQSGDFVRSIYVEG